MTNKIKENLEYEVSWGNVFADLGPRPTRRTFSQSRTFKQGLVVLLKILGILSKK